MWRGIGRLSIPGQTRPRQVIFSLLALVMVALFAVASATVTTVPPEGPRGHLVRVLPALEPPGPVLERLVATEPPPTPKGIAARLDPALSDPALGASVAARVINLTNGAVLYDRGGDSAHTPASTTKITTAAAVLASYPADHRITTTVVAGSAPGQVVLVGGGDPTLSAAPPSTPTWYDGAARVSDLAEQIRRSGVRPTSVVVDGSLFTGAGLGPGWDPTDVAGGYVAPITAVMVDGGRIPGQRARSTAPDLDAGRALARALGLPASAVTRGVAPAGAARLAQVQSPPLDRLVEETLLASDNVAAEMLARQVALATGHPASFAGAVAGVKEVLGRLGADVGGDRLLDGSGLSPADRLTPGLLTSVLRLAASADQPRLHPLFAALPVAGYDGTLSDRYRVPASATGAGMVRAKTGTLTGVSSLAGVVQLRDGQLLGFVFLADEVPGILAAEGAWDHAAAALAGCGCG